MSYVPLGIFTGLAAGDYGLWKWSLAGNHQVLAVIFGLTLLPLALAAACLLVVNAWRLFSDLSRSLQARRARPGRPPGRVHHAGPLEMGRARRASRRLLMRAGRRRARAAAGGQAERPAGKLVA